MIGTLKPYSDYKPSTQAWLGEVPKHWPIVPNRAVFDEVKDRDCPDEEMLSVTIANGIVRQKALLAGNSKKDSSNLEKTAYKLVQPHDIAYNKMRAWQGAIGASSLRGIISPAYVVMRLRNETNLPNYYHHLFRTPQFAKEAERWSYGITSDMWSLRPEHFKMIYAPEPPPAEQAAIVRFLDWANGRLERAIRAKRKVIALLNEQKQAIIHRAVTRGLDSTVALKPSGISWIGDIPEHWEARKLRQLLSRVTERNRPDLALLSVVREKGVIERDTEDRDGNHNFIPEDLSNYKVVRTGQFAMNKMKAWQGSYGVSPFDGIVSPAYFVFNLRGAGGAFFHTAIRSKAYVPFFTQASDGVRVGQWDLAEPRMKEITFFFPSEAEQMAIVDFVTRETTGISVAISQLEREIELLREYRTRLVADVVTGKLDVREAAAQLPDEVLPDTNADAADPGDDLEIADEEATA
jgi:type I restriction enzyme S subunit